MCGLSRDKKIPTLTGKVGIRIFKQNIRIPNLTLEGFHGTILEAQQTETSSFNRQVSWLRASNRVTTPSHPRIGEQWLA